MDDNDFPMRPFAVLCVVVIVAASVATMTLVHQSWIDDAIESGHGRYHPTTGNFEWLPVDEGGE